MLTVRAVVLEYSHAGIHTLLDCEFGGFEKYTMPTTNVMIYSGCGGPGRCNIWGL